MKKLIALLVLVVTLFSCTNSNHKYAIEYAHGKWAFEDYIDTFQVSNGVITYIDENGAEVTRYGTFSIKKNKN
jgi:hypothetical protein